MRDLSRSPNELYLETYIMDELWARTFYSVPQRLIFRNK